MQDVITYKGFIGSVYFSSEDLIFHGKIEGIDDLVTFEGEDVKKLIKRFHEAVEDYLELCKKVKKKPIKSCKGSFNVRISPKIHRLAYEKAILEGISLNQLVQRAIEKDVETLDQLKK